MEAGVTTDKRSYGGESAAQRAARRKEELLETALDLVAADGRSGLNIDAVCVAAGLNKRYFYESFSSLDDLFEQLMTRLCGRAIDAAISTLPRGAAGPDAARTAVSAFISYLTDDPRRGRVLFGQLPPGDAAARSRDEAIRQITTIVATYGSEIYDMKSDERVGIAAAVMVGGTSQAVLDWIDGRIGATREDFVDELVATWLAIAEATKARVQSSSS